MTWSNSQMPSVARARRHGIGLLLCAALVLACLGSLGLARSASAAAPTVSTVDVVELSADGARLRGSVNPGGEATRFWFEYGRTDSYGSSVPLAKDGSAGSGSDAVVVSQAVHGLEPGVDYHFRVVASNGSGTVEGADGVFTTRRPAGECPNAAVRREQGSEFLPDCRAYEQVSPVDKAGQRLGGNADSVVDLTLDPVGGRVLYKGLFAVPPAQSPSSSALAARRTSGGWLNEGLFPAPGPIQSGFGLPAQDMHLRASAPDQRTIAYWDNTTVPAGSLNVRRADGSIVRIVDGAPILGPFGERPGQAWGFAFSPDGRRLYFSSNQRLGPAVGLAGTADILYEWVDDGGAGVLRVVNRTDDPAVTLLSASAASLGGSTSNSTARTNQGPRGLRNAVSDGSDGHDRVFFQNPAPTSETALTGGPVYMREDGERTVQISAPEGANPPATQLRYLDASEDGSRVFFWSGSKLTDDAADGPGIYRYDVDPDGPGDLIFVASAAPVGGAPPTALASPDGENLLFSDGIGSTKVSVSGQVTEVIARDAGAGTFSTLGYDAVPSTVGFTHGIRDDRCPSASVTPDGRYFVFVAGGITATDVYRYDTVAGELKVVSAAPAVPLGPQGPNPISLFVGECSFVDGRRYFKSRLVSDDGRRVFFTSAVALSPDDDSVGLDAYEWFDDGTADGRVSLLTRSASRDHASFLGVDGSGETAFVMSSSRPLVPSDGDQMKDVYAVRVGGGFVADRRSVCAGDSCQGRSGGRPGLASAGSDGVRGAGDAEGGVRPVFSLALPRAQRARLAAGRRAVLRVRVNRSGAIRVLGRATVAGKRRVVVRGRGRARRAGIVLVGVRLTRPARKAVAGGRRLRVVLSASFAGAEPRRLALRLGAGK